MEKESINISKMSFEELMVLFSKNPGVTINGGALLKVLERFEEHMLTVYGLEPKKIVDLNKKNDN